MKDWYKFMNLTQSFLRNIVIIIFFSIFAYIQVIEAQEKRVAVLNNLPQILEDLCALCQLFGILTTRPVDKDVKKGVLLLSRDNFVLSSGFVVDFPGFMSQPVAGFGSQDISFQTGGSSINYIEFPNSSCFLVVSISFEDKFVANWVDLFGIIETVNVEQTFEGILVLLIHVALDGAVLKGSNPIILYGLPLQLRDFLARFKILLNLRHFFLLGNCPLDEFSSLNSKKGTLSRRGLTFSAYFLLTS